MTVILSAAHQGSVKNQNSPDAQPEHKALYMTICHFDEHFPEFFNSVHAARFAVQHHVAVWANGNKIIHGIDHIAFADFADRLFVVDFDFPGEFLAKYQAKIKTAYHTGGAMHGDTAGAYLGIAFIAIR